MSTVPPKTIMALEQGILERLRDLIDKVAIEPFPDDPKNYKLRHQRGVLLVGYRGADFGAELDVELVDQERTLAFDVVVLARGLGSHSDSGAYRHIEATRVALAGYVVPGFDPLVPRRERFLGHTDGVWSYAITFTARMIAVEIDDAELGDVIRDLYS